MAVLDCCSGHIGNGMAVSNQYSYRPDDRRTLEAWANDILLLVGSHGRATSSRKWG